MKITFLGTSHGVPEANRGCSSTLVEAGGKYYLIDAGTNPVEKIINLGILPTEISAIFCTHLHGDHTDGLIPFVDIISWYYTKADPAIYLPSLEAVKGLRAWFTYRGAAMREDLRFFPIAEGPLYDDGVLQVTAVQTEHCDKSYGFVLRAEGKTVIFTGDMKVHDGPVVDYPKQVAVAGNKIDLVVCEAAHFPAKMYTEAFEATLPEKIVYNHYSGMNYGEIYEMQKAFADRVPVLFGTDGLTVSV